MKTIVTALGLLAAVACGSSSSKTGTAPVISEFTMESPVMTTTSIVTGSVYVTDKAGLDNLSVTLAITGTSTAGQAVSSTVTSAVQSSGNVSQVTAAMLPVGLEIGGAIPAGTYKVEITVGQDGAESNSLTATVVVQ